MSENLTPLLKFEVSKNVTAKYDKGIVSEDYVSECKTISTLNNDNDQQNMCSSAPSCSLVLHKPYESHDHYRTENAVESFPSDFGSKSNDRPGPVAGLSFMEVEEDKSLTWYRDIVKGSFSKDRLTIKNSQWKDLAMNLDEDIYNKNEYKVSKKTHTIQKVEKKMVPEQRIKTIERNSMKDVCIHVKSKGISWSKNKKIIKQFVDEYVTKSIREVANIPMIIEESTAKGWIENEEDDYVQCDSPISRRNLTKRSYGALFVDEFIRYYELAQVNESRSLPMRATVSTLSRLVPSSGPRS